MRTAGIIAEYNPFHNGHALHVALTREMTGCDFVVAVMAGQFTQRGEPAVADKWVRARMALLQGVDVVLELPALFAVRSAEGFARGGVSLLGALGVVDALCFGCETRDAALLTRAARLLDAEPPALSEGIREGLSQGKSHARARGEAAAALLNVSPALLNAPNTALALEYLRWNERLDRPMEVLIVQREGGYHDLALGPIASASAVRAALRAGGDVSQAVPAPVRDLLRAQSAPERLDCLALHTLRTMSPLALSRVLDVSEGLEMRILRAAQDAPDRAALLDAVKCKRYTRARLGRIVACALIGLDQALAKQYPSAPYARVLGFRASARPLLRAIKKASAIPLIADAPALQGDPCFSLERRATDLWGLTTDEGALRRAARDLTQRPVIVE